MTIIELCNGISLQPEVTKEVISFSGQFDFDTVSVYLNEFRIYSHMKEAGTGLQNYLGNDEQHIKILSCMLKGAVDAHDFYQSKGISDEIYFDTMKCFTRFIDESYKMTGEYLLDREWWTARQVGCHLFRIGVLEYEIKHTEDKVIINIHIPSDTIFTRESCDSSLEEADLFLKKCFPEYAECEYRCHSWLLCPELGNMLPEKSNIVQFQKRFRILNQGETDTEFIQWIFHTKSNDYKSFPEKTLLQRKMKAHLLAGGVIHIPYGVLV